MPDFQTLMLPLLQHIAGGDEYTIAASRDDLADQFNLTEEERKERLPSGAANRFYNRLAWAKTYLERAGLIEKIRHGCFKISPVGEKVLADSPDRIDITFLNQFPAFREFRSKGTSDESQATTVEKEEQENSTPEEALDNAYQRLRNELAADLLTQIRQASPSFFEQIVVDLMLKMGYGGPSDNAGSVTARGADGGIDGIINEDRLGLDVVYLQAKRWGNTVGRPEIQKFVGALQGVLARGSSGIVGAVFVRDFQPSMVLVSTNSRRG